MDHDQERRVRHRQLGCDSGQGYHIGKPLPARELTLDGPPLISDRDRRVYRVTHWAFEELVER
jgi:EAL domain-containing protein (putative c-di-GMP-specific phosphodiesterase class I)